MLLCAHMLLQKVEDVQNQAHPCFKNILGPL